MERIAGSESGNWLTIGKLDGKVDDTFSLAMQTYWYFYVVRCCDRTLYTGVTTDVLGQLAAHNAGEAAGYTRLKRPVQLAHWERFFRNRRPCGGKLK